MNVPTSSIEQGELVIRGKNGQVTWRGRPLGLEVREVLPIERVSDVVALVATGAGRSDVRNIVRVRADGSTAWTAEVPRPGQGDFYGSVRWRGGRLVATSFSGYTVEIDPETGRLLAEKFTK